MLLHEFFPLSFIVNKEYVLQVSSMLIALLPQLIYVVFEHSVLFVEIVNQVWVSVTGGFSIQYVLLNQRQLLVEVLEVEAHVCELCWGVGRSCC